MDLKNKDTIKNIISIIIAIIAVALFFRFGYSIFRILLTLAIIYNVYGIIVSADKKVFAINLVILIVVNFILNKISLPVIILFIIAYIIYNGLNKTNNQQ